MQLNCGCPPTRMQKSGAMRAAFDLEYARRVIEAEADAITSVKSIVDRSFARACEMIHDCTGSCIVSGIVKPGEKLPLVTVSDTIKQLLEKTDDLKRHGAVIVVGKDQTLAGIITDADLRRLVTRHGPKAFDFKAGDVMTAGCKKIRAEATALFHKYRIDELPVVDANNRPVGLIDVQDVVTIKVVG